MSAGLAGLQSSTHWIVALITHLHALTRVAQHKHIDIPSDSMPILKLLRLAREHRQRQSQLDILVTVDARPD